MIATLLILLVSQDGTGTINLRGQCQYSDAVTRFRDETSLVLCNTLAIDRRGEVATFDFGQRSWGSMIRFSGEMSGRRLTVRNLRLRTGISVPATGTCEIFYKGENVSVVSCFAKAGPKSYATNFVPSRL